MVFLIYLFNLYPVLLFGLPNSVKISGFNFAPESGLLLVLLFVFLLFDLVFYKAHYTILALRSTPWAFHIFASLFIFAWLLSLNFQFSNLHFWKLILWLFTWCFGIYYGIFNFRRFIQIWMLIGLIGALVYILSPDKVGNPILNILAWEHRTTFAYFLIIPAFSSFVQVLQKSYRWKLIYLCAFLIILTAIILSYARGAWIAFIIVISFYFIRNNRIGIVTLMSLLLLFASYLYSINSKSDLAYRVRSLYDLNVGSSSYYRYDLYRAAATMVSEARVLGLGPKSSGEYLYWRTTRKYDSLLDSHVSTDSDIIWMLIEAGPIALILFMLYLFQLFKRISIYSNFDNSNDNKTKYHEVLFFVLIALMIFDNILSTPLGWFLLGVSQGSIMISGSRKRVDRNELR